MAKPPSKRKSGREAASLHDHLSWREQQQPASSRRSGAASAAGGSNANTNGSSSKNASSSSSSSAKRAKIKADPDAADPATTSATAKASNSNKSKSSGGTMFREEALGKRVLVLFDVDTGKAEMGKEWYEGTVTAMTLEVVGGISGSGVAKSNKAHRR